MSARSYACVCRVPTTCPLCPLGRVPLRSYAQLQDLLQLLSRNAPLGALQNASYGSRTGVPDTLAAWTLAIFVIRLVGFTASTYDEIGIEKTRARCWQQIAR